eukprot:1774522-Rhodomonas_salina.4
MTRSNRPERVMDASRAGICHCPSKSETLQEAVCERSAAVALDVALRRHRLTFDSYDLFQRSSVVAR